MHKMLMKLSLLIIGLFMMTLSFVIAHPVQLPFVDKFVARDCADAKIGIVTLRSKNLLNKKDSGFSGLETLYKTHLGKSVPQDSKINHFINTRAFVPSPSGEGETLIEIFWSNDQKWETSFTELSSIISSCYARAIWPLDLIIFIIGLFLAVCGHVRVRGCKSGK